MVQEPTDDEWADRILDEFRRTNKRAGDDLSRNAIDLLLNQGMSGADILCGLRRAIERGLVEMRPGDDRRIFLTSTGYAEL